MTVITVIISVLLCLIIQLYFRHTDKNNRSLHKARKMLEEKTKEIQNAYEAKRDDLQNFQDAADIAKQQCESLLNIILQTHKDIDEEASSLTDQKENITAYFHKIDMLNSELSEISEQVEEIKRTNEIINNVEENINRHKAELEEIRRNSQKIKDDIIDANEESLNDLKKTMVDNMENEMSLLMTKIGELKSNLYAENQENAKALRETNDALREEISSTKEMLQEMKNNTIDSITNNASWANEEINKLNNTVIKIKDGYIDDFVEKLNTIDQENQQKIDNWMNTVTDFSRQISKRIDDGRFEIDQAFTDFSSKIDNKRTEIIKKMEELNQTKSSSLDDKYQEIMNNVISFCETTRDNVNDSIIKTGEEVNERNKVLAEKLKNMQGEAKMQFDTLDNFIAGKQDYLKRYLENTNEKITKAIDGFDKAITNIGSKSSLLENEIFARVRDSLTEFESDTQQKIEDIRTSFQDQIITQNDELSNISTTLNTMSDEVNRIQDFYNASFEQIEAQTRVQIENAKKEISDYRDYADVAGEQMKQYFAEQKTHCFDEIDQKIAKMTQDSAAKNSEIEKKYDIMVGNIENELYETRNKISDRISLIAQSLDNGDIDIETQMKLRQDEIFGQLNDKFTAIKDELTAYAEQNIEQTRNKLFNQDSQIDSQIGEMNTKIQSYKEEILNELNSIESNAATRIGELDANIGSKINLLTTKSNSLEEQYKDSTNRIIAENERKLAEFTSSFENIESQLTNLQNEINYDIQSKIDAGKSSLTSLMNEIEMQISANKSHLDEANKNLFEEYSNEINNLRSNIRQIESEYNDRYFQKYSDIDRQVIDKMQELQQCIDNFNDTNSRYEGKTAESYKRIDDMQTAFESKVGDIENQLSEITEQMLNKRSMEIESLKYNYDEIYNKIIGIHDSIDQIVAENINKASVSINTTYSALEARTSGKIADLTSSLNDITVRMSQLESSCTDSLNEQISGITAQMNDITGKMNEMRNTLDGSITEYINNSEAELNAAFQQRLNDFAAETDRIQNEAVADIQSFETELERFKTQLANFDKHYSEQVAQKFSETDSTLETKLNEMQSVFSGQIAGIKANYQIQTQQLTEEKNQQLGSFREEFDNLINEKNSQLESFKSEFDSLNNDISLIKSRLDSEINSQIDRGNGLLAEAFEAGNAMIEANYAKLHEETERYVNTHKNELLNIRQKTADLESQINDKLRSRFENVDLRIDDQFGKWNNEYNNFIEELKNGIGNTEKDFRDRLTALQTSYIERNDQIVNRNFDRFNELREKLDSISEDMNGINSRFDFYLNQKVEEVNTNFTEKLDAADRNVSQRLTELDNNITVRLENLDNNVSTKLVGWDNNVNDKLSSIDGQITQYVASFKDNVDARFVTIDNDINDKVNQAYSKLDSQVAAIQNEVISKVESINESCKQSTNAMMEENQKHFFESESRIKNIVQNIETYRMQTGNRLNTITNEYIEKIKSAQTDVNSINDKIAHINEIIDDDFQKSYEQNKIDMQLMLDAHKNELENQYRQISDDTISQISECREELRRMNDEFTESFNSTKDTLDEIISNAQESFNDKQRTLNNEILSKINDYRNEFENVKTDMTVVLSSTKDELRNLIASGKNELSEEYQKLQDETAAHISEFRQELMSVRSGIADADSKLADYIANKSNDIDRQASTTFAEINQTYSEQINELDGRLASLESEYSDKYQDLSNIYNGMKSELQVIRNTVTAQIQADADNQFMTTKEQISDLFNHEMNILNENVRKLDESTQMKIDGFKQEIKHVQDNLQLLDNNFSAKYLNHSTVLDRKISAIEDEVRSFEKNIASYEKANSLKEKLSSDIDTLKEMITSIKTDKKDLNDLQRSLQSVTMQYSGKDITAMDKKLTELLQYTETVESKIKNMDAVRLAVKNIDARLDEANEKFNAVAQYMEEIAAKEIDLQDNIANIEKMGNESSQLESKLSALDKKFAELEYKKDVYDEKIRNFEKNASIITTSNDKVNRVIDMYNDLDNTIKVIENRSDNMQKMRKWLVEAETNLENMTHEADKKIKLFEALSDKAEESFSENISDDEEKKNDAVMRLIKQGWTIEDIARSLRLSVSEVDMIRELNMVTR